MSKSISYFRGFISCAQVHRPHYGRDKCWSFYTKQVSSPCHVSAAHSRCLKNSPAVPLHTAPPGAVCGLFAQNFMFCAQNCLFRFAKISFGLFAQALRRNALLSFVKLCSRPYICATQADSLLINGESVRKCRIGVLGSGANYNSHTYVRQKLRLTNKTTHFKLYLKALKKFSRAFILARDLFTFGHLLMITL